MSGPCCAPRSPGRPGDVADEDLHLDDEVDGRQVLWSWNPTLQFETWAGSEAALRVVPNLFGRLTVLAEKTQLVALEQIGLHEVDDVGRSDIYTQRIMEI
jgi:hypothetical protein